MASQDPLEAVVRISPNLAAISLIPLFPRLAHSGGLD